MARAKKIQSLIQLALLLGILIFVNILGSAFYGQLDLTDDKRFTLTPPTVTMLEELDEIVFVKVLLDGKFPAGFKRLQNAIRETLEDFRDVTGYIEYEFENPGDGTTTEINARREELSKDGITPTVLRVKDVDETQELIIYPWAVLYYKGRYTTVNLLESEIMGVPNEVVLNNSVSLLEYKLANAIQKLQITRKPAIVFTKGHGELEAIQTADLVQSLVSFYDVGPLHLDSTYQINPKIDVVIVARPRFEFSERNKFILDQYIMNGGKVLWLIDKLGITLDSLRGRKDFIPLPYELNLDDQLFKYGVRLQPNLVLDMECTRIPLVTGQLGSGNQYDLFPYYYHPLVAPVSKHPIVKSLDRVNLRFPNTIDTVRTKTPVKKTVLLTSSARTRVQFTPVRLNFEVLRYEAEAERFNKPPQPLAVLLEGQFPSLYENRVSEAMRQTLEEIGNEFKQQSVPSRMLVVSDGDLIKNLYNPENNKISPLGFNPFERRTFGANKDFIVNAIEYLLDDKGVAEARAKEVKLRLLNTVKAKKERTKWQLINIALPLVFLLFFGIIYHYWRKRKYAS